MRRIVIAALACIAAVPAMAQPRAEVPIREVVLSDQARRYTIPITVGATAIEAGLDTGSSGLRILPGTLKADDAKADGGSDSESYGAGTRISGTVGHASLTIGGLTASIPVQLVEKADCTARIPNCPASRIALGQFGMQGDGLPGEGFRAIIGINMAQAEIATPLRAIGAARWIVELPRPGGGAPGRLILNPGDDETKDFAMLPIAAAYHSQKGGLHDSVAGCILNATSQAKACGALMMDSGAPGIRVLHGGLGAKPWDNDTPALLAFYDGKDMRAIEQFKTGLREHASRLSFDEDALVSGTVIYAGLTPYFAFDVLYDPDKGEIGLRPRQPAPNAPAGELTEPK